MSDIQHVWEFRAGCHNVDDVHAAPCGCDSCASKRVATVAEQPELDDDAFVQFVGDETKYSVRELRTAQEKPMPYAAPNPYAPDLTKLTTASATEPDFESRWKADRLAALSTEHRRLSDHLDAHPTPRAAEGRTSYAPPNPYESDTQKLRERDARILAAKEHR